MRHSLMNRHAVNWLYGLALFLAVVGTGTAESSLPATQAEGSANKTEGSEKNQKESKRLVGFTEEREAAAMTFVRANHPELAALLEQLKLSDNAEYQRAIRELFHSSEKLAQVQERNPRRWAQELEQWKLNSRIQLLVARLTMGPDAKLESELRQALIEQMNQRKSQLLEEHQRLAARLAELDKQLKKVDQEQNQYVDARMARLLGEASRSRSQIKSSRANSKKTKSAPPAARNSPAAADK